MKQAFALATILRGAEATAPKLTLGKEWVVESNIETDAAATAVRKQNGDLNVWAGNRQVWKFLTMGKGEHFNARNYSEVEFKGYSCPDGYPSGDSCLSKTTPANVGVWPANVYKISEDEILMFNHLEFRKHNWNVRLGLSYSNDGGKTFHWAGYILGPAGKCGTTLTEKCTSSNMGLANYIIKDGYFQVYYQDQVLPDKQSAAGDGTQVAVARAKLADVVAAAKQLKVTPWFKYHEGNWTEPGIGGNFTPLNLKPQGYMHGDAIYVKPLNQYAIVAQTGDKGSDSKHWRKAIVLSFSADGINWSRWQQVHAQPLANAVTNSYPSLVSYGPDNEVAGNSFAVMYNYRDGKKAPVAGGDTELRAVEVTVTPSTVVV